MPRFAVLISPRAEAAFFGASVKVALAELSLVADVVEVVEAGDMLFLHCDMPEPAPLLRLSCAQGVFAVDGNGLVPVAEGADFALHSDFVWGEKYRGKTNETLTQLLINLGLHHLKARRGVRLLDPMCGRGTSLLWAMRYGMDAVGIEQDAGVLPEIRRALKKWTKLHRQKHKLSEGWVQKANKKNLGKYLEFQTDCRMRVVIGDTGDAYDLTQRKSFDLIVTDIPYGVQHMGGQGARSALETIARAAPVWGQCLADGGVMVIAFNAYIPKRKEMVAAFQGLEVVDLDVSHRMSESILRDVLILRK